MSELNLWALAFPTLNDAQVARLGHCAGVALKTYRDGQTLFQVGDRDFKFFVIKSGAIEILDDSGETPKTVTIHRPGEFTGDVAHLTGNPAVVLAVAHGESEVYEMSAAGLRKILNQCPELSDILIQAFIARRQLLRESEEFTGLSVLGSCYSKDTFRVRDFLAMNRALFTWLDLEADPQVDKLLRQFGVGEADSRWLSGSTSCFCATLRIASWLADAIGIRRPLKQTVYDLVGAGCRPKGASNSRLRRLLRRDLP